MKFKATLADYMYLTPRHFILLPNVLNVNVVQAIAQLTKETIFDKYMIQSQNGNCIAVTVDLGLLS
ncbi:unnamed protein product [Calypogeia fissa]